jgi:gliding motility-associated-like protein
MHINYSVVCEVSSTTVFFTIFVIFNSKENEYIVLKLILAMKNIFLLIIIFGLLKSNCKAQYISEPGLIAYYNFQNNMDDISGNSFNGTVFGNPFSGDSLYISQRGENYVTIPGTIFKRDTFTITTRFKFDKLNNDINTIFSGSTSLESNYFTLYYFNRVWGYSYKNVNYTFPVGITLNPAQWYCLTFVATKNKFTLFIDQTSLGDLNLNNDISIPYLMLGQEQDCLGGCFEYYQSLYGMLDKFAVYDRIVTSQEIGFNCLAADTIVVKPIFNAESIPNLITPNGDGKNDFFVIDETDFFDVVELSIYNRWGSKVYYKGDAYMDDWNAADISDGVYYFCFKIENKSYKSWLQIIR